MWVSRRTDYATRAILALAIADADEPLKLEDLAEATAAPASVLEQVMPAMRAAGMVRSERGPQGGYKLNKPADELTMGRVVRLFEGQLAPIACATRSEPEDCPMTVGCSLRHVWEDVRDATIDLLEGYTFAQLAERAGGPWRANALTPPGDVDRSPPG